MQKIDLVFFDRTRAKPRLMSRGLALRIIRTALPYLHMPKNRPIELAVILVGTARMRALNKKWRKKDSPTDVLAFPLHQPDMKGYTSISLGDIFICPMIVRERAARTGLSEHAQMAWTLVHGLLHLAGHDHEHSAAAARKMAVLEHRILGKVNK